MCCGRCGRCPVGPSGAAGALDDPFPASSAGSVLQQPAWNDSTAADWNARQPYSGQDALVQTLPTAQQGIDSEAAGEEGPLTAQYRQHIRRASLDTRTLSVQPATTRRSQLSLRPSHSCLTRGMCCLYLDCSLLVCVCMCLCVCVCVYVCVCVCVCRQSQPAVRVSRAATPLQVLTRYRVSASTLAHIYPTRTRT